MPRSLRALTHATLAASEFAHSFAKLTRPSRFNRSMLTLALTASLFIAPANSEASARELEGPTIETSSTGTADRGSSHVEPRGLARYLSRQVLRSPRFLDHGVLQIGSGAGMPHRYQLDVSLGLFDHLSGGVGLHWLPGQERPQFAPHGAIAFWRGEKFEAGMSYRMLLHNPEEIAEAGYTLRTHYVTGTFVFSQGPFSAGIDVGAVHFLGTSIDPNDPPGTSRERLLPGGGVFGRFGTRRWGVGLTGYMPIWSLNVMADVRFGLFEKRERGGWRLGAG